MKPSVGISLIKSLKERGYVEHNNTLYPPNSAQAKQITHERSIELSKKRKSFKSPVFKSGWIDDTRNIKNRQAQKDMFIRLVEQELQLDVWPEFFFDTKRDFRFDYAIPEIKCAIEREGGIWAKGNSGHSSGKGILRDMEKSNLAQSKGWVVIRRTPDQMNSTETLELIKKLKGNTNFINTK